MTKLHVGDIDLNYEVTGQGRPLLFIHGLGSSGRDWELQVPVFSKHYQVVTVDLRGHGQSSKAPGPYTISLFAADVAGLITGLHLVPAHVVGISLGGMVALQLAVSAPDLVRSLTVVNAGPEFTVQTLKGRLMILQRQLIVRLLGMRKMGDVLSKRLFPKPEHAEVRRLFVERWAENDPRAYRAAARAIIGWSVADRISAIQTPTLVIAADHDYSPVANKEAYVARMPRAELVVIRDSRHGSPVERPEQFNAALLAFLAKQEI